MVELSSSEPSPAGSSATCSPLSPTCPDRRSSSRIGYSAIFKLDRVRPAVVADGLAEAQVRFPEVPIVFCETRPLAQEWTYRFLGAALDHHLSDEPAGWLTEELPVASPLGPAPPTTAEIRSWALLNGHPVAAKGRLRPEVVAAFQEANRST